MRRDPNRWTSCLVRAVLVLGLALPAPVLASPGEPEAKKEGQKSEKSAEKSEKSADQSAEKSASQVDKPRVFTNADLERYGAASPSPARKPAAPGAAPPAPSEPEAPPPEPEAPAEERPGQATVPELLARRTELEERRTYLQAKVNWLRNPLLPAPSPPAGEELLDRTLSGAQVFDRSRSRLTETNNRIIKINQILIAMGAGS